MSKKKTSDRSLLAEANISLVKKLEDLFNSGELQGLIEESDLWRDLILAMPEEGELQESEAYVSAYNKLFAAYLEKALRRRAIRELEKELRSLQLKATDTSDSAALASVKETLSQARMQLDRILKREISERCEKNPYLRSLYTEFAADISAETAAAGTDVEDGDDSASVAVTAAGVKGAGKSTGAEVDTVRELAAEKGCGEKIDRNTRASRNKKGCMPGNISADKKRDKLKFEAPEAVSFRSELRAFQQEFKRTVQQMSLQRRRSFLEEIRTSFFTLLQEVCKDKAPCDAATGKGNAATTDLHTELRKIKMQALHNPGALLAEAVERSIDKMEALSVNFKDYLFKYAKGKRAFDIEALQLSAAQGDEVSERAEVEVADEKRPTTLDEPALAVHWEQLRKSAAQADKLRQARYVEPENIPLLQRRRLAPLQTEQRLSRLVGTYDSHAALALLNTYVQTYKHFDVEDLPRCLQQIPQLDIRERTEETSLPSSDTTNTASVVEAGAEELSTAVGDVVNFADETESQTQGFISEAEAPFQGFTEDTELQARIFIDELNSQHRMQDVEIPETNADDSQQQTASDLQQQTANDSQQQTEDDKGIMNDEDITNGNTELGSEVYFYMRSANAASPADFENNKAAYDVVRAIAKWRKNGEDEYALQWKELREGDLRHDFTELIHNVAKDKVYIRRIGEFELQISFRQGHKQNGVYHTPYGEIHLITATSKLEADISHSDKGGVLLEYALYNGAELSNYVKVELYFAKDKNDLPQ